MTLLYHWPAFPQVLTYLTVLAVTVGIALWVMDHYSKQPIWVRILAGFLALVGLSFLLSEVVVGWLVP